jgi:hypothetical protein
MDNYYSIDPVGRIILLNRRKNVFKLHDVTLAPCPDDSVPLVDEYTALLASVQATMMYLIYVATSGEDKNSEFVEVEGVRHELTVLSEQTFQQMFGQVSSETLAFI